MVGVKWIWDQIQCSAACTRNGAAVKLRLNSETYSCRNSCLKKKKRQTSTRAKQKTSVSTRVENDFSLTLSDLCGLNIFCAPILKQTLICFVCYMNCIRIKSSFVICSQKDFHYPKAQMTTANLWGFNKVIHQYQWFSHYFQHFWAHRPALFLTLSLHFQPFSDRAWCYSIVKLLASQDSLFSRQKTNILQYYALWYSIFHE